VNTSKAGATTPLQVVCAQLQLPRRTSVTASGTPLLQGYCAVLATELGPERLICKRSWELPFWRPPLEVPLIQGLEAELRFFHSFSKCVVSALLFAK